MSDDLSQPLAWVYVTVNRTREFRVAPDLKVVVQNCSLCSHDDLDQHVSGEEHVRRAFLFQHPGQSLEMADLGEASLTESLSRIKNGKDMLQIRASSYVKSNGLCGTHQ